MFFSVSTVLKRDQGMPLVSKIRAAVIFVRSIGNVG